LASLQILFVKDLIVHSRTFNATEKTQLLPTRTRAPFLPRLSPNFLRSMIDLILSNNLVSLGLFGPVWLIHSRMRALNPVHAAVTKGNQ